MKKQLVKYLIMSLFIGLFVVFDFYSIKVGIIKITMGGLPIIFAAILFGPIDGMIVGLFGAFLGQVISYGITPTTILWILPAGIRGLLVGLMTRRNFALENKFYLGFVIVLSSVVVTIINTCVIYVDSIIYNYYSFAYVFGTFLERMGSSFITSIVYYALTIALLIALKDKIKQYRN